MYICNDVCLIFSCLFCNIRKQIFETSGNLDTDKQFVTYHNLEHFYYLEYSKILLPLQYQNEFNEYINNVILHNKLINLKLLAEWRRLYQIFKHEQINVFLLKGLALSKQLFDDALIRHTRDLDIYVRKDDLVTADKLLRNYGYKRVKPDYELNSSQLKYVQNHIHHFMYLHTSKKILLELHWQLFVPKLLFKKEYLLFENVSFDEENLPHYKDEILLHYLIAHGSMHHWFKLIWLYDAYQLMNKQEFDWGFFNILTHNFENERMVNVTLYLADAIFGNNLKNNKNLTRIEKKVVKVAVNSIVRQENFLMLKKEKRFKRLFFLMKLKPSLKYKLSCILAPMTNLEDWKVVSFPSKMYIFYYIFRLFLWFYSNYLRRK